MPGPIRVLRPRLEEAIDHLLPIMDIVPPAAAVDHAIHQYPDDFRVCGSVLVRNGAIVLARRCFHDRAPAPSDNGLKKQFDLFPQYAPQKAYAMGDGYRSAAKLMTDKLVGAWDQATVVKVRSLIGCGSEVEKMAGLRRIAGTPFSSRQAVVLKACMTALGELRAAFGI